MNKTCKSCCHYYNEKWGLGMCFRHDDMTVSPDRAACSWFQTEFRADKTRMCDKEVKAPKKCGTCIHYEVCECEGMAWYSDDAPECYEINNDKSEWELEEEIILEDNETA